MSDSLIAPSYAEIARMHRHFRLLNGSPEALEFLLSPDITGPALETWLQAPANFAAFAALVNSHGAVEAIVRHAPCMDAIAGSELAVSVCRNSPYRKLFGDGIAGRIIGLMMVYPGGGAGTWTRIDENFNAIDNPGAAYFNNHPTYAGIVTQTIDGQQMVKIPKFWFKAGTVPSGPYAGKTYWMISDRPVAGFAVHPAFIGPGGTEYDQIWVGKYQAGYDGSKATSVAGVATMVSMDFPTARARAYARNTGGVTGFRLWSVYDLSAIQMLASIEMGGLDMQSLIGQGRVSASSAANVDASDVAQATWRGIVGLWGNVWQMVDGLKRNGGNWWRWSANAAGNTTTNDFSTGYANTGQSAPTASGYPVTLNTTLLSSGVIVPSSVDGAQSNGSTGDYFWSNTSTDDRIVYHGGAWGDGAYAGLFCLRVSHAPSDAHSSIGCRLAKV